MLRIILDNYWLRMCLFNTVLHQTLTSSLKWVGGWRTSDQSQGWVPCRYWPSGFVESVLSFLKLFPSLPNSSNLPVPKNPKNLSLLCRYRSSCHRLQWRHRFSPLPPQWQQSRRVVHGHVNHDPHTRRRKAKCSCLGDRARSHELNHNFATVSYLPIPFFLHTTVFLLYFNGHDRLRSVVRVVHRIRRSLLIIFPQCHSLVLDTLAPLSRTRLQSPFSLMMLDFRRDHRATIALLQLWPRHAQLNFTWPYFHPTISQYCFRSFLLFVSFYFSFHRFDPFNIRRLIISCPHHNFPILFSFIPSFSFIDFSF